MFKFSYLKKLPDTPPDKDYQKAMDVFLNLEVGKSIRVKNVYIPLFGIYLHSISKLKPINGRYRKTFITKKVGKRTVHVYCESDQALYNYKYDQNIKE